LSGARIRLDACLADPFSLRLRARGFTVQLSDALAHCFGIRLILYWLVDRSIKPIGSGGWSLNPQASS
jgi:hypothetical protein